MKPDTQRAKDFLKEWFPKRFTVEEIKTRANLDIGVQALGGKLRLYRKNGEVSRRLRDGKNYNEYQWNLDYKPGLVVIAHKQPQKAPPAFFWFTLKQCPIASPMFKSVAQLKMDSHYTKGCKIWQGSHEAPLLWEDGE